MRQWKRLTAALMAAALLWATAPRALAEPAPAAASRRLGPGDFFVPRKVFGEVFVCRTALYNVAYVKTFLPMYEAAGVPLAKRTAAVTAAQAFADKACAGDAPGARLAFTTLKNKMGEIADAYATNAAVSRKVALTVLRDVQLTLLAQAFACGGSGGAVASYLGGSTTGTINIAGTPITVGGAAGVVPLSGNLGSCGGGGGGGGGGGLGRGDLSFGGLNPRKLAQCMSSVRRVSNGTCPLADPNADDKDDDQAQDELDDVHEEESEKSKVTLTTHSDGSITLTSANGTSLTFKPESPSAWDTWKNVITDIFALAGTTRELTLLEEGAGLGGGAGLLAAGALIALACLWDDLGDAFDPKPEFIVVPGKLCPVQVGGDLAWWTNPQGDVLNGADAWNVCACDAGTGRLPSRCQSRAEQSLNHVVGCAIEPFATPGDAALCEETLQSSNPWMEHGNAASAMCGYRDCGALSFPSYNASSDICGCSSGGGLGSITIPDRWWTDPIPGIP